MVYIFLIFFVLKRNFETKRNNTTWPLKMRTKIRKRASAQRLLSDAQKKVLPKISNFFLWTDMAKRH